MPQDWGRNCDHDEGEWKAREQKRNGRLREKV